MTIRFYKCDGTEFLSIEGLDTPTEKLDEEDFRNSCIRLAVAVQRKDDVGDAIAEHFEQFMQVN